MQDLGEKPAVPSWLRATGAVSLVAMAAGLGYAVWIALGNVARIGV